MRTICFTNAKGGAGKTTSAVNVAAYLAKRSRVVLVDLDQQASATLSLGVESDGPTSYEVITGSAGIAEAAVPHGKRLYVVPASVRLAMLDAEKAPTGALKRALEGAGYDFAVIDCPPSIGRATTAALKASDAAFIPIRADYLSLLGIEPITETMGAVNPSLSIAGVIVTDYDGRKALCKKVLASVEEKFGKDRTFPVRTCVALAEAPIAHESIFGYDPESNGAKDYKAVALAARRA